MKSGMRFQNGMVAPLVALFVGVVGFPLGYAAYLSVTDYKLTDRGTPAIVGADNFVATFGDGAFWNAFATTAVYVVIAVGLELADHVVDRVDGVAEGEALDRGRAAAPGDRPVPRRFSAGRHQRP